MASYYKVLDARIIRHNDVSNVCQVMNVLGERQYITKEEFDEHLEFTIQVTKLYKNQNINNYHIMTKIQEYPHKLKDDVDDIVMKIDKLFFARTWDVEPKWVEIESIHEKVLSNISLFEEV